MVDIPRRFFESSQVIAKIRNFARPLLSFTGTCAVAGTLLAILAPYGTNAAALPLRLLFWIGLCMAGGIGAMLGDQFYSKSEYSAHRWGRALTQSIGATATVFICFLCLQVLTVGWPGPIFYVQIPFFIWIISIIISTFGVFTSPTHSNVDRPSIYERVKPRFRTAEIYALSAEDHYVRVMTSLGDDLILMRLSDAVKETAPLTGLQVHRSWWVAEKGVKSVSRSEGKMTITLNNDNIVPVSRSNQKTVREAGWA